MLPDNSKLRPELKSLTSLRGIAAMAVVFQHFSASAQANASGWVPSIVPHGYMAVDFFFVLSGFIMCYTYLAQFRTRGLRAYGPFLAKRVARIFPLGIFVTVLVTLCGLIASANDLKWLFYIDDLSGGLGAMIAVNVLHLQGFFPSYTLNDPSWSISVELGTYLLFPILIILIFDTSRWITGVFVLVAIGILLEVSLHDPTRNLAFRSVPFDFARCVIGFSFGMLVFRIYDSNIRLRAIGSDGWTWLVAGLGVGALMLRLDLAAVVVFPFLVLAFALNRGQPSRILAHPWVHYLGVISFSIYLVHSVFRKPEFWVVRFFHPSLLPPWMALSLAFLGSLSILPFAAAAYHCIEHPGRRALNGVTRHLSSRVRGRRQATKLAD